MKFLLTVFFNLKKLSPEFFAVFCLSPSLPIKIIVEFLFFVAVY